MWRSSSSRGKGGEACWPERCSWPSPTCEASPWRCGEARWTAWAWSNSTERASLERIESSWIIRSTQAGILVVTKGSTPLSRARARAESGFTSSGRYTAVLYVLFSTINNGELYNSSRWTRKAQKTPFANSEVQSSPAIFWIHARRISRETSIDVSVTTAVVQTWQRKIKRTSQAATHTRANLRSS